MSMDDAELQAYTKWASSMPFDEIRSIAAWRARAARDMTPELIAAMRQLTQSNAWNHLTQYGKDTINGLLEKHREMTK